MTAFRLRADGRYPIYDAELRQLNPTLSLPETIDATAADIVGADVVQPVEPPQAGPGQRAVEDAPVQVAGVWTQVWSISAAPAPPPSFVIADSAQSLAMARARSLAKKGRVDDALAATLKLIGGTP